MASNPKQLYFEAFLPKSDWKPTPVSELPSWRDAKRVCVDLETHDPNLKELGIGSRRDGYACGIGFAIEDGPEYYLPIRHASGNLDPATVCQYLKDQAKVFKGDLVGAYLSYDIDYLAESGVWFQNATHMDVQVAEPLIYELRKSYSLQSLAELYGLPGKDEELLSQAASCIGVHPKGGMSKIPARYVGPYALQDVRLPLQILRRQERKLEELELGEAWEDECKLLPILVKTRRHGIRIDVDRLRQIEEFSLTEEEAALAKIQDITGVSIGLDNVWKTGALVPALDYIGVTPPLTPKTRKPSITSDFLNNLDHPVAEAILRARKVNKLRGTFCAGMRRYLVRHGKDNYRVHSTFNQMRRTEDERVGGDQRGTISHRLSAEHHNPQQAHARDPELGPMWRAIYVPDIGAIAWGSGDYSQQEPRLTVDYAARCKLPGAQEALDAYINDPNMDFHQFSADTTGLRRVFAKQVFLGYAYGMGGKKLCKEYLNLPTEWIVARDGRKIEVAGPEGKAIMGAFDKKAPYLKMLARRCSATVAERGFIRTLGGGRRNFPRKPGTSEYDWTHKALNALIQTSAARQTKKAQILVDGMGIQVQLPVHDELNWSVGRKEEGDQVKEAMENVVKLDVPFRVDMKLGHTWGECK